jgi:hypothetical protein
MTTLQKLLGFIGELNTGYKVFYDEAAAMNIKTDGLGGGDSFIYVEEWRNGTYSKKKWIAQKNTRMRIYFCKMYPLEDNALAREALREQIEEEAVLPFCKAYNDCGQFTPVPSFSWEATISRFDCNEVSIQLTFDLTEAICM